VKRRDFLKLLGASSIGLLFSKLEAVNLFGLKFPVPTKKERRPYKIYIPVYSDDINGQWIEAELFESIGIQTATIEHWPPMTQEMIDDCIIPSVWIEETMK
jgi:hypothetical protein